MFHLIGNNVKYPSGLALVLIFAVLRPTCAVQFSNFFEVHLQAYISVNPSMIVSVINNSRITDGKVRLEKGMITYETGKFVHCRSPANTVGDLITSMFEDMKIHLIDQLNRLNGSSPNKSTETDPTTSLADPTTSLADPTTSLADPTTSLVDQVRHMLPACRYIPTILNYVYNSDVEFEHLLSSYYAQCVFKDTWCKHQTEQGSQVTSVEYLKNRLIKILRGPDHTAAAAAAAEISKEPSKKIDNWNNFLRQMHKLLETSDKLWVEPEWLTLRFVFQRHKAPLKTLFDSQVHLNDLYWDKPIETMNLRAIYNTHVLLETNSKILLNFYNIVLQKIDWVINRYLYYHFFIIYSNMAGSSESSAFVYDRLKPLMRNCEWSRIIWLYEKLLPVYKKNYVDIYRRQEAIEFMKEDNWKTDFVESSKLFSERNVLESQQLRKMSKTIKVEWPKINPSVANGFAYNYDRTNKWITENCNQAVEFVNELHLITVEHTNDKLLYLTNYLKNYRSREIPKDMSAELHDDSSIFTQNNWAKINMLSFRKRKQPKTD